MLYSLLKFLHVVGVVILLGNVTVTAFWKVFADRTGEPRLVAHGQYLVTVTDWFFTLSGIVLILVGGYGMVLVADINPLAGSWLVWSQLLFLISGLIWLGVLVPVQIRQARAARVFSDRPYIPDSYRKRCTHMADLGCHRHYAPRRGDFSYGSQTLGEAFFYQLQLG